MRAKSVVTEHSSRGFSRQDEMQRRRNGDAVIGICAVTPAYSPCFEFALKRQILPMVDVIGRRPGLA